MNREPAQDHAQYPQDRQRGDRDRKPSVPASLRSPALPDPLPAHVRELGAGGVRDAQLVDQPFEGVVGILVTALLHV